MLFFFYEEIDKINFLKACSPLAANSTLVGGMMLMSPNGKYMAKMQTDGNFVVWYGNQQAGMGQVMWVSSTGSASSYLKFGSDGNLIVYSSSNSILWSSSVGNFTGSSQLSLQM
jgi:hypothetical protein